MAYNAEPNNSTLAEVLAMAPNARQDAVTAFFHKQSGHHNALMRFTSVFDPNQKNGGITSIFAEKTELRAGGKARVHFNTIGLPAGPGVVAANTLSGNESKSSIGNYAVAVDWHRDAISLTEDEIEMIEAGRSLRPTIMRLLAEKMGLWKQNQMLKRLIDFCYDLSATPANWANGVTRGNVYRVGNRANIHQLTPDDTLSLEVSNVAREVLSTLGGEPLTRDYGKNGSPVSNYLMFGTDKSFLPIRNDSLFNTAKDADVRGEKNATFTGKLVDWQGNCFYEMPVKDIAWDDYKGGPLVAKAKVTVEAKPLTATPKLVVNAANDKSLYFQWFDGYRYPYNRMEAAPDLSAVEYYGWACNPDGSRVFFAYNGNHNGNEITITKILCPAQGGTTVDQVTVGQLAIGADADYASGSTGPFTPAGAGINLPLTGSNGAWVYTDTIAPGAIILQANSQGTVYTRSMCFGAMAAMFANGRVKMKEIEQDFDYGFVNGNGFAMIFGTGVALDPLGVPNGYLLIEHAYEITGFPCPAKV